ncbi:threonine synthase [Paenibacillus melissococcoides]|uniref:Threonine synthase n=1 Tax=Paenibacillus melissococcoides TaxID=2912268 RepID=A0ABN8TXI6_9BACL|nr:MULTISPECIES: threonine synthase [Paenibacillus]MEB9894368.1 threonine synthase [Bacillus cereus]CAH8243374.1 threonine synthase [Paenibacillus melissococcoides]CAH8704326.1 threonine synthase [Paenibacillus melissococcoides]CAH8707595.1 threonine synthase [Paenibacillus melissococcoides]GIO77936.1 threonine synthase [Paenibacillus dendritiformis]
MRYMGLLETYKRYLPVNENTPMLTLQEGNTPLIRAERLSEELGLDMYLKYEGLNPTGSFKDRGMVMAVAKAMEEGSRTIMCASTGNTSAAAAAYAARGGLNCIVLIPNNNIALGKLAQAMIYGAKVIAIEGNFDRALEIVREITAKHPITLVNSVNPYRIEGQKTAAFEVCDQLGAAPDVLAIPVGNAGNISAYWKGFKEYHAAGHTDRLPKMVGFEAEGAMAIVKGEPIPNPETLATAIRIGNPASWKTAVEAAEQSGGQINYVTDDQIIEAYQLLASREGVFAEPASAASVAGVLKLHREGYFAGGESVVCVLTGHGLKDPNIAIQTAAKEPLVVPDTEKAVMAAIRQLEGGQ